MVPGGVLAVLLVVCASASPARAAEGEVTTDPARLVPRLMNEVRGDSLAFQRLMVLCVGLRPDTQLYWDIHHTAAATLDRVDPGELRQGTAVVAPLVRLLVNAPR